MKTFTRIILIVLVWILVPLFFLVVGGFIAADFNPFNWSMLGRMGVSFVSISISALLSVPILTED